MKLPSSKVRNLFGLEGLRLVDEVEAEAQRYISKELSRKKIYQNQLVSGMMDKESGIMSDLFTNFTKEELVPGSYTVFS
ncbi:hypothetical protein OKW96_09975 [Sphingobacterium sp. KU25419]|nr:hypothetical protein OKW96_09975 [Sphingobacterium sp. KU25419]